MYEKVRRNGTDVAQKRYGRRGKSAQKRYGSCAEMVREMRRNGTTIKATNLEK